LNSIQGIAWSPDGKWVVAGASHGLWRVPLKTGGKPILIAALEGSAAYPAFSRRTDGRKNVLVYRTIET
jgi:hypothetical protein